ncbi:MAG: hypothetical protein QOD95_1817, partial [Gammaproteobacteria bacterium]|nr:hypothetical protein [Gammaproteobacteria bacterium]
MTPRDRGILRQAPSIRRRRLFAAAIAAIAGMALFGPAAAAEKSIVV